MQNLEEAIQLLKNDNIIAIPTETVYGLAGNAFSDNAVKKIFRLKNRPWNNPLIVHIGSLNELDSLAKDIPEVAYHLASTFWPGPLTIILKKKDKVAKTVTAGLDTVAVRIPDHPLTLKLLERLDFPLAAPSANPFGSISPSRAEHVENYFKDQLDLILDGGECTKGIESTIIGFDQNEEPVLYRHGSISLEQVEEIVGEVKIFNQSGNRPIAPGMLPKHYSPETLSFLTDDVLKTVNLFKGKKVGLLLFKEKRPNLPLIHQEVLSKSGNYSEAAKNLYVAMHRLDQKKLDAIIFEKFPEEDLGKAINDKLRRAAHAAQ